MHALSRAAGVSQHRIGKQNGYRVQCADITAGNLAFCRREGFDIRDSDDVCEMAVRNIVVKLVSDSNVCFGQDEPEIVLAQFIRGTLCCECEL